ncbi:MAG: response regulator [Bacillota bacterium]
MSEKTVLGSETSLRVIVADDDEPTRNLLSSLLETFEGVTVVGKAGTGKEMLDLVRETAPDIVFVDVKMPDLDGLSATHQLQQGLSGVLVVFVSAHYEYARDSYDLDAVDYVVKPVTPPRPMSGGSGSKWTSPPPLPAWTRNRSTLPASSAT